MTSSDFTVLSVLERRHIIETAQRAVEHIDELGDWLPEEIHPFQLRDDLLEVLRILGADDVEE